MSRLASPPMPLTRDDIDPRAFNAEVKAQMRRSLAGGGHHPFGGYAPSAFRHYVRLRALFGAMDGLEFASALDVGSAEGFFMDAIGSRYGADVWGVDISDEAILLNRERYGRPVAVADAQHLPFPDGAFDLVYSTETIEHVLRPDWMVAEMRRVARRWVVVTTPISQSADEHEPDFAHASEGHVNDFDPATVRTLFGPEATLGSFRCNATFAAVKLVGRHGRPRLRNAFYAADHAVSQRLGSPTLPFTPLRNRDWLVVAPAAEGPTQDPRWTAPGSHAPLVEGPDGLRDETAGTTYPWVGPGVPDLSPSA